MPEPVTSSSPLAVVIPAGGGGTRLWPRSRKSSPKQFLDIVTPGRTMLQETVARVSPDLVAAESVFVITSAQHAQTVHQQLPDIPLQNVVGEPVGRDSAPAIGVMAALIEQQLGSDAVMIVLPSDHAISDTEAFRNCLRAAVYEAQRGYLVTLGIPPTGPDTGFGYIQRGEPQHTGSVPVFDVRSFREKPERATAEQYVSSGEYYWNAGMFIARVGTFRDLYTEFLPEMEPHLQELVAVYGTEHQESTFARIFPQLARISFDYAIAEKAPRVAVVPAHIGWSDVGSWNRLAAVLAEQSDENGNVLYAHSHHKLIDTHDSLIYSPQKLVAAIGLDNIVIVDTPDAILIAAKDRSEDVKRIVESLHEEGRLDLL